MSGPIYTSEWPRLSVELPQERAPETCQRCGARGVVQMWQECNTDDRPEPVVVLLCKRCAEVVIEPHPRLYHLLPEHMPWPGAMAICANCEHRMSLFCTHADLKTNGGAGLEIIHPKPVTAHVRYGKSRNGKRGEWLTMYTGPARWCAGKEPQDTPRPEGDAP